MPIPANFFMPRRAPLALSLSGPSKEMHPCSSTPPLDPRTRLSSSPSQVESHRLSSLYPTDLPLEVSLSKPSATYVLARVIAWENLLGRICGGDPTSLGCPLGLRLNRIPMLCQPNLSAGHSNQACSLPDTDTSLRTLWLGEPLPLPPNCGS